jgi:hypothetical protein
VKYDDITALWLFPSVGQPVYNDKLAVMEAGFHAYTFDSNASSYEVDHDEEQESN